MAESLLWGKRRGSVNLKTTLRYRVIHVIASTRETLENDMRFALSFNRAEVVWFSYTPVCLDSLADYIVFAVEGRYRVPIPEDANIDQLKAALL